MLFLSTAPDAHWHRALGEDGPQPHPAPREGLILSLDQWHAVRAHWPKGLRTGLLIDNTVDVSSIAGDLARFSVIQLQFPKWVDGRAYTQARLLRARYGFAGQIRASGEVLVDMVPLLQRCGVDAVVLRSDQSVAVAQRCLTHIPHPYPAARA